MPLRLLLILAMLFTFTACSSDEEGDGLATSTDQVMDPNAQYGAGPYDGANGAVVPGSQQDLATNVEALS